MGGSDTPSLSIYVPTACRKLTSAQGQRHFVCTHPNKRRGRNLDSPPAKAWHKQQTDTINGRLSFLEHSGNEILPEVYRQTLTELNISVTSENLHLSHQWKTSVTHQEPMLWYQPFTRLKAGSLTMYICSYRTAM